MGLCNRVMDRHQDCLPPRFTLWHDALRCVPGHFVFLAERADVIAMLFTAYLLIVILQIRAINSAALLMRKMKGLQEAPGSCSLSR